MERHPLETMFDAITRAARKTRTDYHVTLGEMIEIASKATGAVRFADGGSPGREKSYRGYYEDLAFDSRPELKSAADFAEQCKKALGSYYEGYKGGDYLMDEETPLWRADYGSCGQAIVNAEIVDGDLILHCKETD